VRRTDAIAAGLLVVFLLLALGIRDSVGDLGQMGAELGDAGAALRDSGREAAGEIRGAFDSAADTAGALPIVGGEFADTLRDAGDRNAAVIETQAVATGGDLLRSGRQGEDDAGQLADLLGVLTFLIGVVVVASFWLPRRATAP
jgi:hypothetical protein